MIKMKLILILASLLIGASVIGGDSVTIESNDPQIASESFINSTESETIEKESSDDNMNNNAEDNIEDTNDVDNQNNNQEVNNITNNQNTNSNTASDKPNNNEEKNTNTNKNNNTNGKENTNTNKNNTTTNNNNNNNNTSKKESVKEYINTLKNQYGSSNVIDDSSYSSLMITIHDNHTFDEINSRDNSSMSNKAISLSKNIRDTIKTKYSKEFTVTVVVVSSDNKTEISVRNGSAEGAKYGKKYGGANAVG